MRKVVDAESVAHLWANQEQDEARTPSGNLFFEENEIYSYGHHFMIAKQVCNAQGEKAVLLTKRRYSNTTNRQIGIVTAACRHLKRLAVPDPDGNPDNYFEKWYSEIKNIADVLDRARKPEKYILDIQSVFAQAKAYADFMGLEMPEYLIEAGRIDNIDGYTTLLRKERLLREEQEARERKANLERQQKALRDWRAFKVHSLRTVDCLDYLRFDKDADTVQTSQRVSIPAGDARRFYSYVLETITKGGCTDCGVRLMERYDVLEINKGFIQVGCHKITIKEIKRLTEKLGW